MHADEQLQVGPRPEVLTRLHQPFDHVRERIRRIVELRVPGDAGEQADDRFRWRKGSKPCLYGLWRLEHARAVGHVVLVEGESDAQTLWYHDISALGVPGASTWREDWAPALDGIGAIYVVVEPDKGGKAVRDWVGRSRIRDRVRLIRLVGVKDPSELHVTDPAAFADQWRAACEAGKPAWMIGPPEKLIAQGDRFICFGEPTYFLQAVLKDCVTRWRKGVPTS